MQSSIIKRTTGVFISLALAGVLLGSCKEKENPVAETLSLDPERVDAAKEMASYKIGIQSNASWTVSLTDEEGGDIFWGVLDRSSGTGDATITIRLYENKYKNDRSAKVVVKTKGGLTASATIIQKGDSGSEQDQGSVKLRIGTYNLRAIMSESDPNNDWSVRKERLKQSITDCEFDIVGLQEVWAETQKWLNTNFSSAYTFKFFSPYSQTGDGDKCQGIAWRSDAFTMSNWNFFWMGDTPDIMTQNDTGSSGNFKRGGSCCVLTHNATGIKIFVMCTHACLNSEPNWKYAPQYEKMEKKYNSASLPSFFVGDMNSAESGEAGSPYVAYTSYWKDPYKELPADKIYGCKGTYNGYSSYTGKSRIDFVFYRGDGTIHPESYTCKNSLYGGLYASDHFPVYIDATITK